MNIKSLHHYKHVLVALLFCVITISCGTSHSTNNQSQDGKIGRSTPEEQGISSHVILAFLEEIEKRAIGFHSLMIVRNDKVVAEGWWAPYKAEYKHTLYSLSKSFTSTAIGFAVEEGLLTVNDKVVSFFPDDLPENVSDSLAAMEIKHLLTMSSGHMEGTVPAMFYEEDGNWAKSFLNQPLAKRPGEKFFYNTGATYMLSAILAKVTGVSLMDYLKPRLFDPLGIEGADWEEDPKGINVGGYGLRVKTEDIAKLGLLYLNEGVYNEQRVLSQSWVAEATSAQIDNASGGNEWLKGDWSQGYGYQFWRCSPANVYRGDGAFGQYCIVMPDQNAVIAITSEVGDMQEILTLIWEILLPEMKGEPLSPDPVAVERLNNDLKGLTLNNESYSDASSKLNSIMGQRITFESNDLGFESLEFSSEQGQINLMMVANSDTTTTQIGNTSWQMNPIDTYAGAPSMPSAVTASVGLSGDTLVVSRRFVHTAHGDEIRFVFNEAAVDVLLTKSMAIWGATDFPMKGQLR